MNMSKDIFEYEKLAIWPAYVVLIVGLLLLGSGLINIFIFGDPMGLLAGILTLFLGFVFIKGGISKIRTPQKYKKIEFGQKIKLYGWDNKDDIEIEKVSSVKFDRSWGHPVFIAITEKGDSIEIKLFDKMFNFKQKKEIGNRLRSIEVPN